MNDRYANIPISDKTKEGMRLTIDDLGAISRLLTLQDDAYDEQFQSIKDLLLWQKESIVTIVEAIKEIRTDIHDLKAKVNELDNKIGQVKAEVICTKDELATVKNDLDKLKSDVEKLKKLAGLTV